MEFFERAHVPKRESSKKENKSEENVKKQLKQMLYGYKNRDNQLIKNSANVNTDYNDPHQYFDDSSSVSGFSDLNLTDTSTEEDKPENTSKSITDSQSTSGSDKLNLSSENIHDNSIESIESVSDYEEEIPMSLSRITEESMSCETEPSFVSSFPELSDVESSDSSPEEFDADGILASEILKNIAKKSQEKEMQSKKRKISQKEISASILKDKKQNLNQSIKKNKKIAKGLNVTEQITSNEEAIENLSDSNSVIESISTNSSSPFVSITAIDMIDQGLNEILGDYTHPTVKNIPSEKQNVIYTRNYAGVFSTDDININEMQVDEDIDSLIPELDDQSIDLDFGDGTKLNSEMFDDTTSLNDDSQETDSALKELYIEPTQNYTNIMSVHYGKECCIFVLKHPAQLYINGKVKIKSLGGTVEVYGYTLKNETHELYAPNYNYAQCIKTIEKQNSYYGLFSKLTSAGLSVAESERIVNTIGDNDGIILLQSLRNNKIHFIENNFKAGDLFAKSNKNLENSLRKANELLGCSLYTSKPLKCFEVNLFWKQAVNCGLIKQSRGIVCGGKGTGKSTFLRYYVNKLLAQGPVVVIDLDPGQAEFTVAGNVSVNVVTNPLLGPSFTHLRKPEMMLNIGMINTLDAPARYVAALDTIFKYCTENESLKNMPWIVNTMGLCNNIGLKFLTLTILYVQPTFVLQLSAKNEKKRFEYNMYPHVVKKLYFEEYQSDYVFAYATYPENLDYQLIDSKYVEDGVKNLSLVPREERYLSFLGYFGEIMNKYKGELRGIIPYEVNLKDLIIGTNIKIARDSITKVINGKIVALCQQDTQDKGTLFTLGHKVFPCHGHGLIRGIELEKEVLYIITPTPLDKLSLVNLLVYCDWVPELKGQERHLPAGITIPYRTASAHQQRQLMFSPKRRFNPLQLLKVARSS